MEPPRETVIDDLFIAILTDHVEGITQALVKKNPNYYSALAHYTPLSFACAGGKVSLVKQLLAAGAGTDFQVVDDNSEPLHPTALTLAALRGYVEVCAELMKHGANPNPRNPKDFTPLHAAARNGNTEIIEMLIGYGAKLNAQDSEGMTPLHEVIPHITDTRTPKDKGNYQACLILLQAGANPNAQTCYRYGDQSGYSFADKTPLMLAAQRGKLIYVYLLILMGSHPTLCDRNGETAWDLAPHNIRSQAKELLYI